MTPRKHAELIKAWADGAEIQFRSGAGTWIDSDCPWWLEDQEYRIKPVPKADTYWRLQRVAPSGTKYTIVVTHDGETGEAKKVEIVK